MNRNLVYFSILLILLGVGSGFYLLSLLGALVLIPALLSPARPPLPRRSAPQRQEVRRIIPPTPPQPATASPAYTTSTLTASPSPTQSQGYSGALFPSPMFPSLSQMGTPVQTPMQSAAGKQETRDELVEVGAILALLKLVFG